MISVDVQESNVTGGNVQVSCHRAVVALGSLRLVFPGVDELVFQFNGTPVIVRPEDTTDTLLQQWETRRRLGV